MSTPSVIRLRIQFPQETQAQAVLSLPDIHPDVVISALRLPSPNVVMMIMGGAGGMERDTYESLRALFMSGVAPLAVALNATVIDGGTQEGVMALMGEGFVGQARKPILLGVAPTGKVTYPGKQATAVSSDATPLDPNHTHFVLVETDAWGGETAMMYALAQALARQCPSVAILVNGGPIARNELLYNVRQQRPTIVIEGSGRLADEIAHLWRERPALPQDAVLSEILAHGDIHLFPLSSPLQQLEPLVRRLLSSNKGTI